MPVGSKRGSPWTGQEHEKFVQLVKSQCDLEGADPSQPKLIGDKLWRHVSERMQKHGYDRSESDCKHHTYSSTPIYKGAYQQTDTGDLKSDASTSSTPPISTSRPKRERIPVNREGFVNSGTIEFDHRDRLHPPAKKARLEPQRSFPNLDHNDASQVSELSLLIGVMVCVLVPSQWSIGMEDINRSMCQ